MSLSSKNRFGRLNCVRVGLSWRSPAADAHRLSNGGATTAVARADLLNSWIYYGLAGADSVVIVQPSCQFSVL
jgi:hypothetical protein